MPTLSINGQNVTVKPGTTILEAAGRLGISIPTLCYREGHPPNVSCMLCAVAVEGTSRLVAACATPAEDGMIIQTDTPDVHDNRRIVLELMLSHHTGDCEAPCTIACPAGLDIPRFLRCLQEGETAQAAIMATETLVLPRSLGRICPAPCEKVCRRGRHDAPVAIPALHLSATTLADIPDPALPDPPADTRPVAIVGAGPAGLAAGLRLRQLGYRVAIFDAKPLPGGGLRYGAGNDSLISEYLDADISVLVRYGLRLHPDQPLEDARGLTRLREQYAAVILACGTGRAPQDWGLAMNEHGIEVRRATGETSIPGVFAAGSAIREIRRLAVRAIAGGRRAAEGVDSRLRGTAPPRRVKPVNVRLGTLREGELERLLESAAPDNRLACFHQRHPGNADAVKAEAARCLHCDCRAARSCRLREFATEYGASTSRWSGKRPPFEHDLSHPDIVVEPGKCIACGICTQITEQAGETFGMAFLGRGIAVRIGPPGRETAASSLTHTARMCVEACPTGALSFR